jgi:hypothetical protein
MIDKYDLTIMKMSDTLRYYEGYGMLSSMISDRLKDKNKYSD